MSRGGKTARSRATRARVIAAASELFVERGYLGTTMAVLAEAASVSVQTLYLAFGSKVDILKAAHDVAVVGDDEDLPVLGRDWSDAVREAPDARGALELLVQHGTRIVEQTSPFYDVIRAGSADEEVAELHEQMREQRLATWSAFAEVLASKPGRAASLSADQVADLLYVFLSPDLHHTLVVERGWSLDDWRAWILDTLIAQLIAG